MAATKKAKQVLRTYVHVTNDKGETTIFEPGQELPAWAAKLAQNPKLFVDEEASESESTETQPPAGGATGEQKPYAEQDEDALRDLLKGRELPQDGDKAALVARLEQADAEAAAAANSK
jgi:hypothetical protein